MKQAKRLDRLSASAWYFISESYYKRITDFIKESERNPDLLNTTKNLPADYGAISVMAEMLTKSYLMGLDRSTRKMEFAEPTAEEIETLPYAEAVEYLKKRDILTKVDYKKLTAQLKFRAFTASRISDGALLKRINGELIKSIESGEGLKAFLEMAKTDLLNKVGLGNAGGWYWETVYRTNVQTAYNAGRMMGYEQDKPYALELVVIDDARTTEYCRQYAGKGFILPYSDPFWRTHIPPFHFNCRTTIRAIYDQDELPESWSSKTDLARPAKGFGKNPVMNDDWWKELSSQVRQAKMYGVQGEIEAAEEKLIEKQLEIKIVKNTGARSKVITKMESADILEREKLADEYYENIRNSDNNKMISKIVKHTGKSYGEIESIINHIFKEKHHFQDGRFKVFDSDIDIVRALERLKTGEHTATDILLLDHEYTELTYMKNKKYNIYEIAHAMANKKFNWQEALKNENV